MHNKSDVEILVCKPDIIKELIKQENTVHTVITFI